MKIKVIKTKEMEIALTPEQQKEIALHVLRKAMGFWKVTQYGGTYLKSVELGEAEVWEQEGRDPRDTHTKLRKATAKDKAAFLIIDHLEKLPLDKLSS